MSSDWDEEDWSYVELDAVGLCRACVHARVVSSARGSTFYLCRLSETDPRFEKYPRLPIMRCAGYSKEEPPAG